MTSSWARSSFVAAASATAVTACIALSAGMVRILPWLLDPNVTWRVASPFAQSVGVVALEAALAVGWPVGWALATMALVEKGEGRVLALLGERPARTVARLGRQAAVLATALGLLSFASARESTEPGRVVSELIAHGRAACATAGAARTYTVPFFGATWLCGVDTPPRLVGQAPGRLAALTYSARDARASGDLGTVDLEDAHLALASPAVSLHVDELHLRGAAPWGHAATVAPMTRALTLSSSVALSGLLSVGLILTTRSRSRGLALLIGASGPVAALGLLRTVERFANSETRQLLPVLVVPLLALAVPLVTALLGARLPELWHAASRYRA